MTNLPLTKTYLSNFEMIDSVLVINPSATGQFEMFTKASTDSGKYVYQAININITQQQAAVSRQAAPVFDTSFTSTIPITIELDKNGKYVAPTQFVFSSPKVSSPMGNKVTMTVTGFENYAVWAEVKVNANTFLLKVDKTFVNKDLTSVIGTVTLTDTVNKLKTVNSFIV